MKKYQSLDHTRTIVTNATNHTAKLVKQSQLQGNILARLLEFALWQSQVSSANLVNKLRKDL